MKSIYKDLIEKSGSFHTLSNEATTSSDIAPSQAAGGDPDFTDQDYMLVEPMCSLYHKKGSKEHLACVDRLRGRIDAKMKVTESDAASGIIDEAKFNVKKLKKGVSVVFKARMGKFRKGDVAVVKSITDLGDWEAFLVELSSKENGVKDTLQFDQSDLGTSIDLVK
jgi:hypothetical protein